MAVAATPAAIDWEVPEQQIGLWSDAWTRFRRNRLAVDGPWYIQLIPIFGAIALVNWVGLARLVRGQVLSIKEKEYVEAARSSGSPPLKLILKHLLPNSLGPIIVTLTFGIPQAIFLEAVLSFLGVGIQPPQPTWGQMVFDGYEAIYANPSGVVF